MCHEKSGKLALAKREYEESLVRARADRRKDREKVAAEAIARLVARIPRVGLLVHETAADLVVRVDGAEVPRPEWSSVALDPGTHTIEASASGRITWQASIVLTESQVTTFDIPPLAVLAPEPSPLVAGAVPPPPPSPLPPPPPPDVHVGAPVPIVGPPEKKHWLFWPMVATSGAMLGTSAVTGILALVEKGNADAVCNASRGYCINSKGLESIDRARTYAWISTITLGVGVAAAAVALFLPNQKVGVGVIAGPSLVGLSWQAPLP